MSLSCPTCQGYLAYYVAYHNNIGEEIPADLRCVHCGTSVIHKTHSPVEEKKGSGYAKKEAIKKVCVCGCKKEFFDRTSNHKRKFFDHSHKSKHENLINNQKRKVRDDEARMIEEIEEYIKKEYAICGERASHHTEIQRLEYLLSRIKELEEIIIR